MTQFKTHVFPLECLVHFRSLDSHSYGLDCNWQDPSHCQDIVLNFHIDQIAPLDVDSTCLNCAWVVHLVHICLENYVNFYHHSDQVGSDSEDVAEESNREKDRVLRDMDGGHQVYRTHSDDERDDWPRDEVAVVEVEALDV